MSLTEKAGGNRPSDEPGRMGGSALHVEKRDQCSSERELHAKGWRLEKGCWVRAEGALNSQRALGCLVGTEAGSATDRTLKGLGYPAQELRLSKRELLGDERGFSSMENHCPSIQETAWKLAQCRQ